ncbi:MAG: hypothetical protein ACKO42_08360 [Gammaproteobacteria bacterium]
MLIEPRRAAPGAVLRWSRQAIDLLRRGLGFWSALSLLMCLWMFVGHRLPLLSGILALVALLSCMLIASHLDRSGRISLAEALEMLRSRLRAILIFAAIITVAGALVWVLLLAKPGVAWWNILYTERNSVDVLSADGFVALRQIFVYSAFALGLSYFGLNLPGLTSFFQFLCMTLLDLPFRDAWRLAAAGQISNLGAMLGVALLFVLLPAVFALVLPPLVPVLYCFFGALGYVAFREIFLGVSENQPREVAAMAGATPLSSRA